MKNNELTAVKCEMPSLDGLPQPVIEYVMGLVADNLALRELIEQHAAGFVVCESCSHEEPCETDDIVALYRSMDKSATDAAIAEIKSRGLDECIDSFRENENIDEHAWNDFHHEAKKFAANLRAGRKG